MRIERALKIRDAYAESVHNIYENAARFRWDAEFVNNAIADLWANLNGTGAPVWVRNYCDGVRWHCDKLHWRLMEFSYEVDGVRMMITEKRYRAIDPVKISRDYAHTGAFVYREDPTILYTKERGQE